METIKYLVFLSAVRLAERKPVGFIIVILGVETATTHVQGVRVVTTTVGCGRPPVSAGVLVA